MEAFYYIVRVDCETKDQADKVMTERLGPDEDYGFDYTLDWAENEVDE